MTNDPGTAQLPDRQRSEEAGTTERFEAVFGSMAASVTIMMPDGRAAWVNPGHLALTGFEPHEVVGQTLRAVEPGWCRREIHRADGTTLMVDESVIPVRDYSGRVVQYVITQQMSENEEAAEVPSGDRLDPVTGLPGQRTLDVHLDAAIGSASPERPAVLMILDIDHFHLVNEAVGHKIGDQVLRDLAHLLADAVGPEDLVVRWGGDEFGVLLRTTSKERSEDVAGRIQATVGGYRVPVQSRDLTLGCAVGIAILDGRLAAPEALSLADAALYRARDLGPGRMVVLTADDQKAGVALLEEGIWATRLRDALRSDGMTLHFQPVVNLQTNEVAHHEALVRMQDDGGGIIAPGKFVPVAERFGLITELDHWVAGRVLDLLEEDPTRRLFMNVSGSAFESNSYLPRIRAAFRSGRLAAGQLVLEVTESAAVRDFRKARKWINDLTTEGCQFALDDFGTGYCTFSYLRDLPVSFVKIDRSLITHVGVGRECGAMVNAIIAVAHSLGKTVIAEGVEHEATAEYLRAAGVEYGQGFLLGHPTPEDGVQWGTTTPTRPEHRGSA